MYVTLYSADGTKRFNVTEKPVRKSKPPVDKNSFSDVLKSIIENWTSVDEIVRTCNTTHPFQTNREEVEKHLESYDIEKRIKHGHVEVRIHSPKASESHRKSCFATLNDLKSQLERENLSQTQIWEFLKHRFNISSRKELDTRQWVSLAAELQGIKRDLPLFQHFIRDVKQWLKTSKPQ